MRGATGEAMTHDALVAYLVERVLAVERPHPVRVAIDGFSASGKTSLADDLAEAIERRGRPTVRAGADNFKRPWSERGQYDRESGEGYYRNAYDYNLLREALLEPLGPDGDRRYRAASIDPLTQRAMEDAEGEASPDAVLIVDGVFLLRPEVNEHWDLRVFLDIDFDLVLQRGAERDQGWAGGWDAAADLYRTRYIPSEEIYLAEVRPHDLADIIIDRRDFAAPRLIRG